MSNLIRVASYLTGEPSKLDLQGLTRASSVYRKSWSYVRARNLDLSPT